ncbi:hypothetical protein HK405_005400 [Cladochytrium tenue]|nr:hypothetical protein HK405_005400 [Cladochytrium tenue]
MATLPSASSAAVLAASFCAFLAGGLSLFGTTQLLAPLGVASAPIPPPSARGSRHAVSKTAATAAALPTLDPRVAATSTPLARLAFAATLATSCVLFELIIIEIAGLWSDGSREFFWILSLSVALVNVIVVLPYYQFYVVAKNTGSGLL